QSDADTVKGRTPVDDRPGPAWDPLTPASAREPGTATTMSAAVAAVRSRRERIFRWEGILFSLLCSFARLHWLPQCRLYEAERASLSAVARIRRSIHVACRSRWV